MLDNHHSANFTHIHKKKHFNLTQSINLRLRVWGPRVLNNTPFVPQERKMKELVVLCSKLFETDRGHRNFVVVPAMLNKYPSHEWSLLVHLLLSAVLHAGNLAEIKCSTPVIESVRLETQNSSPWRINSELYCCTFQRRGGWWQIVLGLHFLLHSNAHLKVLFLNAL